MPINPSTSDPRIDAIELRNVSDLSLDRSVPPVRLAYAAAHIVTNPRASADAALVDQIDWEATLSYRRYLWSLGFGVAEAMDTAQRNLLGWDVASKLLERTLGEARSGSSGHLWTEVMGGAGTDGLQTSEPSMSEIVDEYVRQGTFIQSRGGTVILLASPLLPARFPDRDSYVEIYSEVCRQLKPPIFLHWLGDMFAPNLAGYFPGNSFWKIMETNSDRIKGVKISLLDEAREVDIRSRLRNWGQVVLTGDDFNYTRLILGDGSRTGEPALQIKGRDFPTGDFSHALLGVFDAIAPVAAKALEHLAKGEVKEYNKRMGATEPLGRHIFEAPTSSYKAGVIFLAYLNGHQDHFAALGNMHRERSVEHYIEIFRLANECGALRDPKESFRRLKVLLK